MTQIESAIQAFESKQLETPELPEVEETYPENQVLPEGTFFNVTLADIERRVVAPVEGAEHLVLCADEDKYNQITGVIFGGTLNSGEIEELAKNSEIQKTPGESWYVVSDEGRFDFLTWTGEAFEAVFIPRKGVEDEAEPPVTEVVTEPVKEDDPAPEQVDPIPPAPIDPPPPPPIVEPDPTPVQEPQDIPEPAAMPKAPEGLPPSVEAVKGMKIIDLKKPKSVSTEATSKLKVIQLRR